MRPQGLWIGRSTAAPGAVIENVRGVLGMDITHERRSPTQVLAAQLLLGIAGLALLTAVCFHTGFGVSRTASAFLMLITALSLLGSFSASIILSVVAIACLNYFFVPPLFEWRIDDPQDVQRLAIFFTTSLVVTALTTKLRASQARFRTLVEHAADAFFLLDKNSTVLDVNRQACDSLGYGREELIGKNRRDFTLDEGSFLPIKQRIIAGEEVTFETHHRRKDGSSFPVEIRARYFEQGGRRFLCLARDITDRKAAEEAVRRSESYLAEAQRLSHTGTTVFTEAGYIYWSEESYRLWGLDPSQGLPAFETVLRCIHSDDRDRVRAKVLEALHHKREYRVAFRVVLPDGSKRHLESTGHPLLSADGKVAETVATHVDVGERVRAQDQSERLRQLEADLAHMNRLSIMGELTASLAHEILHPIATARNNARAGMRFLEMSPPNLDEVKEALGLIVRDADRAKDIVGRIRDQIKKAPPRREAFDLNEAINEVIVMVRDAIDRESVSVRTRFSEGMGPVRGDRVELQQVVLNLILNAVEAMSSVQVGTRELSISTEKNQAGDVVVAVRDSGPGIDPEHVDQIFKPFYTTKTSGIGVGLAICRSIIDAHGGRLWACANQPRGAAFQFSLPSAEDES